MLCVEIIFLTRVFFDFFLVSHRSVHHQNAPANPAPASYNPYQKSASYFNEPPPSQNAASGWEYGGPRSARNFYGQNSAADAPYGGGNEFMAEQTMNFAKAYGEQLAEHGKQQVAVSAISSFKKAPSLLLYLDREICFSNYVKILF